MSAFLSGDIREIFFLVLRLLAAAGGFMLGWFVTGPVAAVLVRLAFHRALPRWMMYWCKLLGGLLIGLLVFWFLPLGSGGGGGGSGGGTGKGVGPFNTDGSGAAKVSDSGKGAVEGQGTKGGPDIDATKGTVRLDIELLGGEAVKDGKYYLLGQKSPAVNGAELKTYLEQNRQKLAGVNIVLTDQSVGDSHQAYRYLLQLALDYDLRPSIVPPGKK